MSEVDTPVARGLEKYETGLIGQAGRWVAEPMSSKTPTRQERTAPTPADIRQKDHIGTDTENMGHYLDRVRQTIYVLDGDRVAHTESVADRTVGDWVAYVRAARGWAECNVVSDLRTLFERAGVLE